MYVKTGKRFWGVLMMVCAMVGMWGCGKDDGGGPANGEVYLTCKIDGVYREFNAHVNANDKPDGEVHFVVVSGHETEDGSSPGFGMDLLVENGEATTAKYTTADAQLQGVYYEQTANGTKSFDGNGSDGTSFEMNITRLDDWGAAGTFSGVLNLGGTDTYITVTDGKFSAPYNGND